MSQVIEISLDSNLTVKQVQELTELLNDVAKMYLRDPDQGRWFVLNSIPNFTDVKLSDDQIESLMKYCSKVIRDNILNNWNTSDLVEEEIGEWMEENNIPPKPPKNKNFACKYVFSKGPRKGDKCGTPTDNSNQICDGCCKKKDPQIVKTEEEIALDVVVVDQSKGIYRIPQHNIIIQELEGKMLAKGVCIDRDVTKLRKLNESEIGYCNKLGLTIDDKESN